MEEKKTLESFLNEIESSTISEYDFCIQNGKTACNAVPFGNAADLKQAIEQSFYEIKKYGYFGTLLDELSEKDIKRISHIVSVLLLLHIFYRNNRTIAELINNELASAYNNDGIMDCCHYDFAALLLALCHDLGYIYEIEKKNTKDCNVVIDTLSLYNDLLPLFTDIDDNFGKCQFLPNYVSPQVIVSYIRFVKKKDHGIWGALEFWKKMKSLAEEHNDAPSYPKKLYIYVACHILVHNIWFCYKEPEKFSNSNRKHKKNYTDNGLASLVLQKNEPQIKPESNPLLFLFALVDTIDPVKYALKNEVNLQVTFTFKNNTLVLTTNSLKYLLYVEEIKYWLVPNVSRIEGEGTTYKLEITLE